MPVLHAPLKWPPRDILCGGPRGGLAPALGLALGLAGCQKPAAAAKPAPKVTVARAVVR